MTKTIKIEGMSCGHCAKKVEKGLKEIKEVKSVTVDLEKKEATIVLKKEIDSNRLKTILEDLGYQVM
ncbi:MAG: heavy-metal-associated domain-containing protein [Clostridia bacterium]|nr:heavy-metal-associated domain-containing protein [Clostridia bacterium]